MLDDGVMEKLNGRVPEPPVEVKLVRNEWVTVFGSVPTAVMLKL
jgi:hypothetical protein